MDLEAVLAGARTWPAEERLRLVEAVWDGLSEEEAESVPGEDLKVLVDRRIEALDRNPDAVIPWKVVEARALDWIRCVGALLDAPYIGP